MEPTFNGTVEEYCQFKCKFKNNVPDGSQWKPLGPERIIKGMVLACSKREVFATLLVNILAYFNKGKEVKRTEQRALLAVK